jgi:hypothetical protein
LPNQINAQSDYIAVIRSYSALIFKADIQYRTVKPQT